MGGRLLLAFIGAIRAKKKHVATGATFTQTVMAQHLEMLTLTLRVVASILFQTAIAD